ncbi:hypothetical protein A5740_10305 [Mycobacterium sp. GA-1841]|uniref:hypothetical protein n=1 Tax=Mycobacterium sp. GA-1841 TaxID=1834154 RepID=UPI00096DE73D|nr:hypothetical protein [Mycobacterium sp. GA-1841]OMC34035.1 hypothetical protein A5740_10305 [Mycobacterium sp. GA-1841]
MNIVSGAVQAVSRTADATTATAGAIGGAAVNGVVGGIKGVGSGIRSGMSQGSRSPAAAALTLAAVGAAGLVEWPVLLTVGGAALVVHQLNQRNGEGGAEEPDESSESRPATRAPKRGAATKRSPSGTSTRTTAKSSGRRSSTRRTGTAARAK